MAQQNAAPAGHRLGENADQFAARYAAPNDSPLLDNNFPLLEGAIYHTYMYEGWRIRAAFVPPDGPAVRMEYSKIVKAGVNAVIRDYESQAIMTANTAPGTTWKEIMYDNPDSPNKGLGKIEGYFAGSLGQKMWQRSMARSYGCAANSLSAASCRARIRSETQSGKGTESPRISSAVLMKYWKI